MYFHKDMGGSFTVDMPEENYQSFIKKMLGEASEGWTVEYTIQVRKRQHKKRRIDKKWEKRYGYRDVVKALPGSFQLSHDGSGNYIMQSI